MTETAAEAADSRVGHLAERMVAPLVGFRRLGFFLPCPIEPTTALIFLHGLGGHPQETWMDLLVGVSESSIFERADVLLYGYDSLRGRAYSRALEFLELLKALTQEPSEYFSEIAGPAFKREPDWRYTRIVVVGHSLGALIGRLAVLEAVRSNCAHIGTELVLLAPAHMGSHVVKLATEAFADLRLAFLVRLVVYVAPIFDDLREGSSILEFLRVESQKYKAASPQVVAKAVATAENDLVIVPTPFPGDPVSTLIHGAGHTDITRPDREPPDIRTFMRRSLS